MASAGPLNVAPLAKASASSCAAGYDASGVNDGMARIDGRGEWASDAKETFWGEIDFPSVRLDWDKPVEIDRILLYDRMDPASHTAGVTLRFSDGTRRDVGEIPADGSPREVELGGITSDYVIVEICDGTGDNIGLSEIRSLPYSRQLRRFRLDGQSVCRDYPRTLFLLHHRVPAPGNDRRRPDDPQQESGWRRLQL